MKTDFSYSCVFGTVNLILVNCLSFHTYIFTLRTYTLLTRSKFNLLHPILIRVLYKIWYCAVPESATSLHNTHRGTKDIFVLRCHIFVSPVVAIVLGCVRVSVCLSVCHGNIVNAITPSILDRFGRNFTYGLVVTLSRSSSTASNFHAY
jgi:hypothetical protein